MVVFRCGCIRWQALPPTQGTANQNAQWCRVGVCLEQGHHCLGLSMCVQYAETRLCVVYQERQYQGKGEEG